MYHFDETANRAGSDSVKWKEVSEDVLPMWVADMDILAPLPIREALLQRVQHPFYGYPYTQEQLTDRIVSHYEKTYHAAVDPAWIVWVPSVIPGVVTALQTLGGESMYSTPMYDHIRCLHAEAGLPVTEVPMQRDGNLRYTMDMDALETAVKPAIKSLILCILIL